MKNYLYFSAFLLFFLLVFTLKDLHAQWVLAFDSSYSGISSLKASKTNIFAGTCGGIFRTTNNGEELTILNTGIPPSDCINCLAIDDSGNIFAGSENAEVYKSTNNGASWSKTDWPGYPYFPIYAIAISDSILFSGNEGGEVFCSKNKGATWSATSLDWHGETGIYALAALGPKLFAGTYEHGVYFSSDNGKNWSQTNAGLPNNSTIFSFTAAGSNLFAGTWGNGVYLSTDSGKTWSPVNNGLPGTGGTISDKRYINVLGAYGTYIFAGTEKGVFLSADNGAHWINTEYNFIDENGDISVRYLAASNTDLFAAGLSGRVYKRPLSELLELVTDVEASSNTLPSEFYLGQNYPNPFNPSTKISWQSPVAGYQTLKVYDVLGNEVATLVDEYKPAGRYEVTFDGSNLSSGVYYYQLKAGNFVETKKLVLIR